MRANGAIVAIDGGVVGGGGGGLVDSVNGIAPVLGDVTLTATDIPSTGPSTVQADLAVLDGSTLTNVAAFQSWPEFAALCIEGPVGVWTFDGSARGAGTIIMSAGARVILGDNHTLVGGTTSVSLTWIANVDAPAFTGPLSLARMTVVQTHPGAEARCLDLDTVTRPAFVTEVQCIGGRVGLRAVNVGDAAKMDTIHCKDNDVGFQIHTGTYESLVFADISAQSAVPGFLAFTVDAAATITGGLNVADPAFILASGQFGFAIAHAATLSGDALIQVAGASNAGSQDSMFRQTNPGVTDMDVTDDRLVAKGGPSAADWSAAGVASRTDPADPLIVAISLVDTDTLIPYEDALANLQLVASLETHFTFFKGVAPTDWHWEYSGPLEGVTASVVLDILHDRSAGTGFARLKVQCDKAPGYAGFTDVPDPETLFENTNSVTARTSATTVEGLRAGDRLRVVAQNAADTTNIRLQEFKVAVRVG